MVNLEDTYLAVHSIQLHYQLHMQYFSIHTKLAMYIQCMRDCPIDLFNMMGYYSLIAGSNCPTNDQDLCHTTIVRFREPVFLSVRFFFIKQFIAYFKHERTIWLVLGISNL